MKKLKYFLMAGGFAFLLSSCAATMSPVTGFIYTDTEGPLAVTGNSGSSKVGESEATSILGWIGQGNASVQEAAKKAGITKIHHVDYKSKSILGVYAKYTTVVYGE